MPTKPGEIDKVTDAATHASPRCCHGQVVSAQPNECHINKANKSTANLFKYMLVLSSSIIQIPASLALSMLLIDRLSKHNINFQPTGVRKCTYCLSEVPQRSNCAEGYRLSQKMIFLKTKLNFDATVATVSLVPSFFC